MTAGLIYMCFGRQACQHAKYSIDSMRRFSKYPVCIVGDEEAGKSFSNIDYFKQVDIDPFDKTAPAKFQFMAGRIKPLLAGLSPFDQTLYVDADTTFRRSPEVGFKQLGKYDVVIAETETRDLYDTIAGASESKYTQKLFGIGCIGYHNSGMIFWQKNDRTNKLFDLWAEEWQRFSLWDEQVALLRALVLSDVIYRTVPYTWNCKHGKEVFLIHHAFGAGIARQQSISNLHKTRYNKSTGVKMVRLEVQPGRFVQCNEEDVQEIMQKFSAGRRSHG